MEEDLQEGIESFNDDSDLPSEAIIAHVLQHKSPVDVLFNAEGDLMSAAVAESPNKDPTSLTSDYNTENVEALGVSKQNRKPNTLYRSAIFWCHQDDDPDT